MASRGTPWSVRPGLHRSAPGRRVASRARALRLSRRLELDSAFSSRWSLSPAAAAAIRSSILIGPSARKTTGSEGSAFSLFFAACLSKSC